MKTIKIKKQASDYLCTCVIWKSFESFKTFRECGPQLMFGESEPWNLFAWVGHEDSAFFKSKNGQLQVQIQSVTTGWAWVYVFSSLFFLVWFIKAINGYKTSPYNTTSRHLFSGHAVAYGSPTKSVWGPRMNQSFTTTRAQTMGAIALEIKNVNIFYLLQHNGEICEQFDYSFLLHFLFNLPNIMFILISALNIWISYQQTSRRSWKPGRLAFQVMLHL